MCYFNELDKKIIKIYMENSFDIIFSSTSWSNYWNIYWNPRRRSGITWIYSWIIKLCIYCKIIFWLMYWDVFVYILYAPILPSKHNIYGFITLNIHNNCVCRIFGKKICSFISSSCFKLWFKLYHRYRSLNTK